MYNRWIRKERRRKKSLFRLEKGKSNLLVALIFEARSFRLATRESSATFTCQLVSSSLVFYTMLCLRASRRDPRPNGPPFSFYLSFFLSFFFLLLLHISTRPWFSRDGNGKRLLLVNYSFNYSLLTREGLRKSALSVSDKCMHHRCLTTREIRVNIRGIDCSA